MASFPPENTSMTTSNLYTITATTTTAIPPFKRTYREAAMIETPGFIQIDMLNGTKISGRFTRYSDPQRADGYGAWCGEDVDGTKTYVLWAGILRMTVFPLDARAPEATPLEKPEA